MCGERQLVFVTGEAGIGKTALVETFVQSLASRVQGQEEESQKPVLSAVEGAKGKTQKSKVGVPFPQASSLKPLAPRLWVAVGQCIEHYGVGEAYLPVLEAVGRLCRGPAGKQLLPVLEQYAPSWLVQLPALLSEADYGALQQRVAGTTRKRMLREIAEALEVMSAERPLVLVLEDLHWSDASTIDFLSMVARRREAARLLVVGTNRPAELVVNQHPLKAVKQELVTRGHGTEVLVERLSAEHVQRYLQQRLAARGSDPSVGALVYRRTEGHPLFMVQLTDYLVQQGESALGTVAVQEVETQLPQQLRELIEAQVERLTPGEQEVLAAGSVAGAEFTLVSVAMALEKPADEVETLCEQLARRGQFIVEREVSQWPDGTVSGRYGFRHTMYQEVLYQRLSGSRRIRLHQRIGEREEAGYGTRTSEIAAELAMHFERGRDDERAVCYLQQAGEKALNRSAHAEAIALLSHAIEVLRSWPDTPERVQQDLALHLVLGPALVAGKGHGAPEVEQVYRRAAALCEQLPQHPQQSSILSGLGGYSMAYGDFATTFALGERLLPLAQQDNQPTFEIQARRLLGTPLFWQGKFVAAREHLEKGILLANAHSAPPRTAFTLDPGVACRSYASFTLWALGYPAQAVSIIQDAVTVAQRLLDPHSLAFALEFVSRVHLLRREGVIGQGYAETLRAHATEYGFSYFQRQGLFDHGWALVEQGQEEQGITLIRQALAALQEIGIRLGHSQVLAVLGEACGQMGQSEEGLRIVSEALTDVEQSDERVFEAELWRLRGELTLAPSGVQTQEESQKSKSKSQKTVVSREKEDEPRAKVTDPRSLTPDPQGEAEACFLKAIDIARAQQAKSLELRAVMSLVRLRQQQAREQGARSREHGAKNETAGKRESQNCLPASQPSSFRLAEAHRMLAEVYNWFTEGFDTKDLQEAKTLLKSLESSV